MSVMVTECASMPFKSCIVFLYKITRFLHREYAWKMQRISCTARHGIRNVKNTLRMLTSSSLLNL